jgi:L-alanine-DL-glutamate epimerase-like enolase superfamily enzyme
MSKNLHLTCYPVNLALKTTFRIAHGASDQRYNVIACLEEGLGEAAVVPYYGDTQAGIMDYLELVSPTLGDDPFLIEDILNRLPGGSPAARAAVDIALHDLWGKRLGQPLYRLLGLNPQTLPLTSFTIAIDEPAVMAERAAACGYPVIKIKLGSPDDEAIVAAIRRVTDARLRVDANAGWSREEAARLIPRLVEYDLEFIEQPLAAGDIEGLRWLKERMRLQSISVPLFADESVRSAADIAAHAGAIDGVVIKLMKSGGIRAALRAIHTARALDLQIMIGCMVETVLGVTAAAHLAPLCDFADLDGPLLIRNDPFKGLRYEGSRMILPTAPGLGVEAA